MASTPILSFFNNQGDRQTDKHSVKNNFPHLSTSTGLIERVTTFKLLGINFEANLSWSLHINTISAEASKRLYFLKQLKRARLPTDQLLHFYVAVIRPVVEYCAVRTGWHYAINRAHAEQLESIQKWKWAIRIIFPFTRGRGVGRGGPGGGSSPL